MIGSGIFLLPPALQRRHRGFDALFAWVVTGGMFTLARVFRSLARRKPDLGAGYALVAGRMAI